MRHFTQPFLAGLSWRYLDKSQTPRAAAITEQRRPLPSGAVHLHGGRKQAMKQATWAGPGGQNAGCLVFPEEELSIK